MATSAKADARSLFANMEKKEIPRTSAPVIEEEPVVTEERIDRYVPSEIKDGEIELIAPDPRTKNAAKPQTKRASSSTGKKRGRPKVLGEGTKKVTVELPLSVLNALDIAKRAYGGSTSSYVRTVIMKDYEDHKDFYNSLPQAW